MSKSKMTIKSIMEVKKCFAMLEKERTIPFEESNLSDPFLQILFISLHDCSSLCEIYGILADEYFKKSRACHGPLSKKLGIPFVPDQPKRKSHR